MTYREISEELGIPIAAVRYVEQSALKKLRAVLADKFVNCAADIVDDISRSELDLRLV